MRFSAKYATFTTWLRARPRTTEYAQRIIRGHQHYAASTLKGLRAAHSTKVAYASLNASEKATYNRMLHGLNLMRHGRPLTAAAQESGFSGAALRKRLGNVLIKKGGRWTAKLNDPFERSWQVFSNGKRIRLITTNFKDASTVSKYLNAVKEYLETGNRSVLAPFKNVSIKDASGKLHTLETRPQVLRDIDDMREDDEWQPIYNE